MSWNTGPALPETMRAIELTGYGGPEVLRLTTDRPLPPMAPHNEAMVEVHAAGLNPFSAKLRRGVLARMFPLALPHILGIDVAGVVVSAGFDVSQFAVGDKVWGLIDALRPGSYAEYVAAPAFLLRPMPTNLSFAEAAAVPTAGCTAWHGLVNLAEVQPGQRVLVQAGSGGVGAFAIQIAKARGAWVAATTSTPNVDFVRGLGADLVIDYTTTDFVEAAPDCDVVLDVIGGEVGQRSYHALKPGGTLLVVLRGDQTEMANRVANQERYGVTTHVVAFSARPDILDTMKPLFEDGTLRVPLTRTWALEDAAAAHTVLDSGRTVGKMALAVR